MRQGVKDSRGQGGGLDYSIFKIFTRTVEPFDKPFDKLTVLSNIEGLTALSNVEGPWNP